MEAVEDEKRRRKKVECFAFKTSFTILSRSMEAKVSSALISADGWFSERNEQWPGIASSYKVKRLLVQTQTKYQDLMIFESTNHGKVLCLDGVVQLTETDEFIYHEMMVHPVMFAHPDPRRILVIGGGDGGVIRELCKHDTVESIDWCEIDEEVVTYSTKYFPQIAASNNDPRVHLHIGDGYKFVADAASNWYDVIVCDSSDPIGPAKMLFTKQFYTDCHRILNAGGIMGCQSECMFQNVDLIKELVRNSKELFKGGAVGYSSMYVPMYPYGQIGCLINRKYCKTMERNGTMEVDEPVREIPLKIAKTLKYYSKKIHSASFVLPTFMQSKL